MHATFIKKYSLLLFCTLLSVIATAQSFSYVYIQGDKETPFYIKMDDQMLPRYGKNYNIISQLAPGPITIQILFQQNLFPLQKFTIQVPENGSRGFLLVRKGDGFSLYDLQQQFYLPAGNSIADDHAPVNNPGNSYVTTKATAENTIKQDEVATKKTSQRTKNKSGQTQPQFIDNIELNDKRSVQTNTVPTQTAITTPPPEHVETQAQAPVPAPAPAVVTTPTPVSVVTSAPVQIPAQDPAPVPTQVQTQASPPAPVPVQVTTTVDTATKPPMAAATTTKTKIANSDCPNPIGPDEYEDILEKMTQKSDKTRLKFLLSKLDKCFSTKQIYDLTMGLPNDPERYAFLKQSYSRVTDQANFPSLEELLKTQEWRSYFRLIMP